MQSFKNRAAPSFVKRLLGTRGSPVDNTSHNTGFASCFQKIDGPHSLPVYQSDDSGRNDGIVSFFQRQREEIGKLEKGLTVSNFDLEKL